MICPNCNNRLKIIETIPDKDNFITIRNYKCMVCGEKQLGIESIIPKDSDLYCKVLSRKKKLKKEVYKK